LIYSRGAFAKICKVHHFVPITKLRSKWVALSGGLMAQIIQEITISSTVHQFAPKMNAMQRRSIATEHTEHPHASHKLHSSQ